MRKTPSQGHTVRVIPRLDIKGPNVVKGVHLEGLRVMGDPAELALRYYEEGADEILYVDSVASLYGRNNLLPIVEHTAKEVFVPLTVGGGVRTMEDIYKLLRAGADKVAINTAAVRNPPFIRQAVKTFGSQCIVVSIEAKWRSEGRWEALTDTGREKTGMDACEWAMQAARLGAGEVLITSIDREGTGTGYDLELTRRLAEALPIPVIASGGAGSVDHIKEAIIDGKADAVCVASVRHYRRTSLRDLKSALRDAGLSIRLTSTRGKQSSAGFPDDLLAASPRLRSSQELPARQPSFKSQRQAIAARNSFVVRGKTRGEFLAGHARAPLVVVDYGLGNLFSVMRALQRLGAHASISADPRAVARAGRIIIPGVGAFGDGMRGLTENGLIGPLRDAAGNGKPILGICLGMQLLMEEGVEFGLHKGLGIIEGRTVALRRVAPQGQGPARGLEPAQAAGAQGSRRPAHVGRHHPGGTALYFQKNQESRLLLKDSFFRKSPPKSLDRGSFGEAFLRSHFGRITRLNLPDTLATLTLLTARSIEDSYRRFILPKHAIRQVLVSGGGSRNPVLMRLLRDLLRPIPVSVSDMPAMAKEAACFAWMAGRAMEGKPNNCPIATGARGPRVLGKIIFA
ncbi:MAG: imidazole glycerol phosphate synthase subunit HisF [Elusimicrobia bacterium]|nr:imidazole glycerol phosphate synthase subunit HisF [Elusimicrobiota bacterium]